MNLPEQFEKNLQEQKLILPGDKVFVACSGGPDSVALFFLLKGLPEKWNLKLGIFHLNHSLRGSESRKDQTFVRKLARQFRVPFYSQSRQVLKSARKNKESLEEAARKKRYDFFIETARCHRIPKVALGHTQNDQAETVLMRILQGTGLRGLLGIRPQIQMGGITFVRPFLDFSKKEILSFLKEKRISFRRDKSNQSDQFIRNRIRLRLLPWLEREFNPRLTSALARLPVIVKEENELLEELERAAWKKTFRRRLDQSLYLNRNAFLKFPSSLQFRLLQRALQKLDIRSGLSFDAWQKLRPELRRTRMRHSLPRDIDLSLTPSRMILYKKFPRRKRNLLSL